MNNFNINQLIGDLTNYGKAIKKELDSTKEVINKGNMSESQKEFLFKQVKSIETAIDNPNEGLGPLMSALQNINESLKKP